ncbi:hypothetical protein SELMODRAFT_187330 [Selaginella moellendorffii]|uniref:DNA-(apurinic or apyrimidinic site) endonuclease n=1 Tax=Selaginella moellendorffii TaxID=88036 RepID=D8TCC8_SELML|nr:DNA-(apurinic or apyrimidinic site) lyase [Selaginella moellendorffii]EFJ05662.1 hypothetical protein SELMODRAFT_187330 [Selaginella moellendorffii]|eukprot:XP_002993241.1 DNA-(apurinic or apyrimidinic site) lyase [Selaginella moellendorffii]
MKRFFQPVERDGASKKPSIAIANGGENACADPSRFMSWNANSLLLRFKNNREEVMSFIRGFDPDVICIQEVRLPAAGFKGEKKNPGEIKDDSAAARNDKQAVMRVLSVSPMADYSVWWSLGENKYAGTALFVKNCFKPVSVAFNIDNKGKDAQRHEIDGRIILAEFGSFTLLNTYAPNNGWKEEENGFVRRRAWDKKVLEFVSSCSKPLIWCGDLNVSHQEIDVTHPEFFANATQPGYTPPNKEDAGQPGFTLNERARFSAILNRGNLVDTYRHLHEKQDLEAGFTWSGNPVGKYRGKRMRIDYFLISKALLPRLASSKIHGRGIELEGFLGSDHCPLTMELKNQACQNHD